MRIVEGIKKRALVYAAVLVLLLVGANTIAIYHNEVVLKKMTESKIQTDRAKFLLSEIWNQAVRNIDVGVRGYAPTKKEGLLSPYKGGLRDYPLLTTDLRKLLMQQEFEQPVALDSIITGVDGFINSSSKMVDMVNADDMAGFTAALNADPGRNAWFIYKRNSKIIKDFEDNIDLTNTTEYEEASYNSKLIQTILFIIGFPTLLFMIFRIGKEHKLRLGLFLKLEKNNRAFIFDPGTPLEIKDENEVIENSIVNYKKATYFIREISSGNFTVDWEAINAQNASLNTNNLAGELMKMRERMKAIKDEDEKRSWINEGVAKFSDVIREHQQNLESLSFEVLKFIVKYLNAQQGGLFVLKEDEENIQYLELSACYAFEKKKHGQKRVELGQGMVGQIFLEGESTMLTEIPEDYLQITSGLGDAKPNCLLIVPMKYNSKVEAIIEIASFKAYEKYEIEFVEKLGEITASTLGAVKNTEKVQLLLDQFKEQTELLKAQEEELRQNMEEMEATQEAMRREERERIQ